jgi:hypothetical protein
VNYREFADAVRGLASMLVSQIRDEKGILPMIHFNVDGRVHGVGLDPAFFDPGVDRMILLEHAILPYVEIMRPESVAWTFAAWNHGEGGMYEHEMVVACVIDRERAEVWQARLVRHDGVASHGAWRAWPEGEAIGPLINPIQEHLR